MRTVLWALVAAVLAVPTLAAKEVACQASARQTLERGYVRMEDGQLARTSMPQPAIPGHELFGEMLLQMGEPQQAHEEFAISQRHRLHRPASILGLARSAALLDDQEGARARAAEFLEWWSDADDDLPELDDARKLMASGAR